MQPNLAMASVRCPVMSRASPTTREALARYAQMRSYKRGSNIFLHSSPANSGYVLISGWVKVSRVQASGSMALLNLHAPGEVFGFSDSIRRVPRSVDAEAATDCVVLSVPYHSLRSAMRNDASFNDVLLGHAFEQNDHLLHQLEGMKVLNSLERLACFLIRHAKPHGPYLMVKPAFEKQLVASYLGIRRETLSRNLTKLRDHGVRESPIGIEITDLDALKNFVGAETLMFCNLPEQVI